MKSTILAAFTFVKQNTYLTFISLSQIRHFPIKFKKKKIQPSLIFQAIVKMVTIKKKKPNPNPQKTKPQNKTPDLGIIKV